MAWLDLRGEADKVVTPHEGYGFEERGTKRVDVKIDGSEGGVHGGPCIGEDSKGSRIDQCRAEVKVLKCLECPQSALFQRFEMAWTYCYSNARPSLNSGQQMR
jgi:hypothetical protein